MAYFNCHFFSSSLAQNVNVDVLIPSPDSDELMNRKKGKTYDYKTKFPVLYLLHGAYGDYSDWQRYTSIEKHAQNYHMAVVMASAGNSFYHNMERGQKYRTFFLEELPEFITNMFPVSRKREDTFIAGLSMGGYGAYYLAMTRPEQYSAAASLSGALDIAALREKIKEGMIQGPFPWNDIFKDPDKLEGTSSDLFVLFENCREKGMVPKLYQACGTEDFLYEINQGARKRLSALGAEITYEEGLGIHDWNFWDTYIRRVFKWLSAL